MSSGARVGGDGKSPRVQRLRRWAIRLGCLAVASALVLSGWLLHEVLADETVNLSVERPVEVVQDRFASSGSMPSVLGLEVGTARQVIADAGFDLERVSNETVPYVGEPGVVVRQTPGPGEKLGDGAELALSVSAPGAMPDLAGLAEDEARERVIELGARTLVQSSFSSGSEEGAVLRTDPPAGSPLRSEVSLIVAEPSSSVFLSELRRVQGTCEAAEARVDGEALSDALTCVASERPVTGTYLLDPALTAFEATVGFDDGSGADDMVTFRVVVDGRAEFEETLRFGDTRQVKIPLAGASQLRLEAELDGRQLSLDPVRAVFAEPRLVGGRSVIDKLVEEIGN